VSFQNQRSTNTKPKQATSRWRLGCLCSYRHCYCGLTKTAHSAGKANNF